MNWRFGAFNTLVLVTRSLTMILALNAVRIIVHSAPEFLLLTIFLGFTFLGLKWFEYTPNFTKVFCRHRYVLVLLLRDDRTSRASHAGRDNH